MKLKTVLSLFCLTCLATASISGKTIPFYLCWRSTSSYLTRDLSDVNIGELSSIYAIYAGLDTLYSNGIRARVALTNQESRLNSQAVFDHVILDYNPGNLGLQLAIKDIGLGKGFLLYNRRFGDALYDKYPIARYRWYGGIASYSGSFGKFEIGAGTNELNMVLSQAEFKLDYKALQLTLYSSYAHKDNVFTTPAYNLGYEAALAAKQIRFHSAYIYKALPKTTRFSYMHSWHLTNEVDVIFLRNSKLVLSTDNQSFPGSSTVDHIYEVCLDQTFNHFQSYTGLRHLSKVDDTAMDYFVDVNWNIINNLTVGLFSDYVYLRSNDRYYKYGLQASYRIR